MNEWISCEERMPEMRKTHGGYSSARVLVATSSIGVQIGHFTHTSGWFVAGYHHRDVTHWMPLPYMPDLCE